MKSPDMDNIFNESTILQCDTSLEASRRDDSNDVLLCNIALPNIEIKGLVVLDLRKS